MYYLYNYLLTNVVGNTSLFDESTLKKPGQEAHQTATVSIGCESILGFTAYPLGIRTQVILIL